MAFTTANPETVYLRRPPQRDNYGDPIPGTAVEVALEESFFAPGPGREMEINANQAGADGTVFIQPEHPEIFPQDQMVVRDEIYEVVGRPRVWLNEVTEVPVRIVTG